MDSQQIASIGDWIERLKGPGFAWHRESWMRTTATRDSKGPTKVFGELTAQPRAAILYQDLGPTIEILALMTHPDHQKQGLMRLIGESFFPTLTGKTEVWLEVHAQNLPARRLYEIWGFAQVGERPHYYGPGQSAFLMTKTLPS